MKNAIAATIENPSVFLINRIMGEVHALAKDFLEAFPKAQTLQRHMAVAKKSTVERRRQQGEQYLEFFAAAIQLASTAARDGCLEQ